MQIVVNHLTRMQKGYMCVAGIELEKRRHIRPVVAGMMPVAMYHKHGGPFELRRVIDLGETTFHGSVPEIEDQLFEAGNVKVLDELSKSSFYEWCCAIAAENLQDIFGADMRLIGRLRDQSVTAAIPETMGIYSLGCFWARKPHIEVRKLRERLNVRFGFEQNGFKFDVPVTDIRCYQDDHVTPDSSTIELLQHRLVDLDRVLVSIGVSRAYHHREVDPKMHWLQINNIHLPV